MIKFTDVHKTYKSKSGSVEALKGISFDIDDGEFVFVIGKSGSGKSTLLKCITCEERPTEGTVTIDGFNIAAMSRSLVPVLRRQIGMIYQDFRLIESKTVFENVAFAGEIIGIPRKNLNQSVQLMLNVVGLKDKANAYPQELSGGEQQRVAIARAMINNPKIIVADEPTGNLDPEISENIMALLQEINRNGSTVIVCTHDSNLVDRMKKRVIEISDGVIARDAEGSLYSREAQAAVEAANEAPKIDTNPMNVAFGDDPAFDSDREYSDNFDEDSYIEEEPITEVFFGESPLLPEVPAAEESVVNEEVAEIAATVSAEVVTEDEVSALPVDGDEIEETLIEDLVEETVETPSEEEVEETMPSEEESEEAVEGTKEEVKEDNDDNWIEEIGLSDIDLDIQEDDD